MPDACLDASHAVRVRTAGTKFAEEACDRPAIAAGGAGDVRIAWMDARAGGLWNTYYRSSIDSGASWSVEADLSTYVPGYSYIAPDGFSFPFGDYFELDIDELGSTHAVWLAFTT